MLTIADVLAAEDVTRVREGLAVATFGDGKRTAGGAAKKVKAAREVRVELTLPPDATLQSGKRRADVVARTRSMPFPSAPGGTSE